MNQIMQVGRGIVMAIDGPVSRDQIEVIGRKWGEMMPDVPAFFVPNAQIIERGETTVFQFTGNVSPTMVAEFQRWWEEVNRG